MVRQLSLWFCSLCVDCRRLSAFGTDIFLPSYEFSVTGQADHRHQGFPYQGSQVRDFLFILCALAVHEKPDVRNGHLQECCFALNTHEPSLTFCNSQQTRCHLREDQEELHQHQVQDQMQQSKFAVVFICYRYRLGSFEVTSSFTLITPLQFVSVLPLPLSVFFPLPRSSCTPLRLPTRRRPTSSPLPCPLPLPRSTSKWFR